MPRPRPPLQPLRPAVVTLSTFFALRTATSGAFPQLLATAATKRWGSAFVRINKKRISGILYLVRLPIYKGFFLDRKIKRSVSSTSSSPYLGSSATTSPPPSSSVLEDFQSKHRPYALSASRSLSCAGPTSEKPRVSILFLVLHSQHGRRQRQRLRAFGATRRRRHARRSPKIMALHLLSPG